MPDYTPDPLDNEQLSFEGIDPTRLPGNRQQRDDLSLIVQNQTEAIAALMNQMQQSAGLLRETMQGYERLLGNSVTQTEKLANAHAKVNDEQRKGNALADKYSLKSKRDLDRAMQMAEFQVKDTDAKERSIKAMQGGTREIERQLRAYGAFDKVRQKYLVGNEFLSPSELRSQLETSAEARQTVHNELRSRIAGFGSNPRFSVKDLVSALARGDIGGAAGEALQRVSFLERLVGPMEQRGIDLRERGLAARAEATSAPQIIKATAQGLTGRGIAGVADLIAKPGEIAIAYELGKRMLSRYVIGPEQDALRTGRLTGEGLGAGIAAKAEEFKLRVNPFDLIGAAEAKQIVEGVRGEGFRGEMARGLEDSIKDVVNTLGINVKDAMDTAFTAIRQGGLTVQEFTGQMDQLRQIAHDTNLSIGQVTEAFKGFTQIGATTGQAVSQTIGPIGMEFTKNLPVSIASLGLSPKLAAGVAPFLALTHGQSPYAAASPKFWSSQFLSYWSDFVKQLQQMQRASGMNPEQWANFVLGNPELGLPGALPLLSQYLPGITPNQLAQIVSKGAPNAQQAQREARQNALKAAFKKPEHHTFLGGLVHSIEHGVVGAAEATGKFMYDNSAIRYSIQGPDIAAQQREQQRQIAGVEQTMKSLGYSQADIDNLLAPARQIANDKNFKANRFDKEGHLITEQRAFDQAFDQAQKTVVEVRMNPTAARYLDAHATTYQQSIRGLRGSQGIVPPPTPNK